MTVALAAKETGAAQPFEQSPKRRETLLLIDRLNVEYVTGARHVPAVRDVSLGIQQGEVVALVGESGSGKSTIALAAMGMLPANARIASGSILLEGEELIGRSDKALNRIRGRQIGWIPQDPLIALNPLHRVGRQVAEPLRIHKRLTRQALAEKVQSLLERVHIADPETRAQQYPHELSGGMRQRVLIAGAIGPAPRLIIADEPTTALDVTVQKSILDDIDDLIASDGMSMLLITHDLGVAADRADRIVVLKDGQIVEEGTTEQILRQPGHDYTRQLLASAPNLQDGRRGGYRERQESTYTHIPVVSTGEPILSIRNVSRSFAGAKTRKAKPKAIQAVIDVSLDVIKGKTLALVGESGSGKSTTARIALGLTKPDSGSVLFDGVDTRQFDRNDLYRMHRLTQPIYQNPFASLDPRFTIADIIAEPLAGFRLGDRGSRRQRIRDLMDQVGLPASLAGRYPTELSGGQRQRVAIARALAPEPALLICDEPVSALDVSIQAQILDLLTRLQQTHHLSFLFISHDLAVVRQVADDIAVMKDGRIVEAGQADAVFDRPRHDYTKKLLASVPGQARRWQR